MKNKIKLIILIAFLAMGYVSASFDYPVKISNDPEINALCKEKLNSLKEYDNKIIEAESIHGDYKKWIKQQHLDVTLHNVRVSTFEVAINDAKQKLESYKNDIKIEYVPIDDNAANIRGDKYLTYGVITKPNGRNVTLINPEDVIKKIGDKVREQTFEVKNSEFKQTQENFHIVAVISKSMNGYKKVIDLFIAKKDLEQDQYKTFEAAAYSKYYYDILKGIPNDLEKSFTSLKTFITEVKEIIDPVVCSTCSKPVSKCTCTGLPPYNVIIAVGLGTILIVIIIVLIVVSVVKPKKCMHCGSVLVNGVCNNQSCPINVKHCSLCGSNLGANGKCTNPNCPSNPPPPPPKCNLCGGNLDANGYCTVPGCPNGPQPPKPYICRFCGQKASRLDIHEVGVDCGCAEETKYYCDKCGKVIPRGYNDCPDCNPDPISIDYGEETCVQADFGLKFVEPRKFADKYVAVPSRFVLGKNPKNEFGFVRAEMNLASYDEESKNTCSRNYVRFEESDDGFSVTLLSKNKLSVDGVQLKTDQVAQAKVGSRITLKPDWVLEVVKN